MTRSTTDYTSTMEKRPRSDGGASPKVPLHFAVHKPGCHVESCCGVCNLFPGVLLIAFGQVLVGSVLLTLILTHGTQYDAMHLTPDSQIMSMASGAVLSGVTGAGLLLIVVALTENCRAMLVYLLVAMIVLMGLVSLAVAKIGRACIRFKDASKIKDEQHRLDNLACVSGLFTFFGAEEKVRGEAFAKLGLMAGGFNEKMFWKTFVSIKIGGYMAVLYFFSFVVVFSFYHFRYVRRAILLHEADCA